MLHGMTSHPVSRCSSLLEAVQLKHYASPAGQTAFLQPLQPVAASVCQLTAEFVWLNFGGEEEALTFAVGGWNVLQLEKVEKNLDLWTQRRGSVPQWKQQTSQLWTAVSPEP